MRELYDLDLARLNLVMAWIGYQYFWSGDDHVRAQEMIDDTRRHVCDLVMAASTPRMAQPKAHVLATRILAGYVIGLRRIRYGRVTLDEAVVEVLDHVFA